MSEVNPLNPAQESTPDELTLLKQQATLMGISFSNNIKVETLRAKIAAKMDGEDDNTDDEGNVIAPATQPNPLAPEAAAPVAGKRTPSLAQYLQAEAMKLVRVRIACMDPKKQDLEGEIFTVANEHIGTVRKHVPFGEKTDNGYHIPQCLLDFIRSRKFLSIQTKTLPNGQIETKTRWVPEFSIEVLPQLTQEELRNLAADQRATGRLEGED